MNFLMIKPFIVLFSVLLSMGANFHPIHLSVCEVNYNKSTKGVEIALKVFFDDLEEGVIRNGGPQLHLFTDKEEVKSDEWILKYLQEKLQLKINDKDVTLHWVGKETDEKRDIQSLWIYLEVPNVKKVKDLEIKNTILCDVHQDQRNMLHLKCNGKKVSWLFDIEKISETIHW
ncbi:DUF6702 family protein [Flammeovirga sp. OC4]|uniref:DUF6702 family protein n=1 Tax=Flammeovirga sp. OC4 TaxID=1382345 RepID=UPI0012E0ABCD|nr:DUF6702 family protein [Flammeovirga sp. OC4]